LNGAAATIDYDYSRNLHTVAGARAALELLFNGQPPQRLLDVGCGRGTWLRAALDLGAVSVYGIDGSAIHDADLLFPAERFRRHDLSQPFDLGEHFDVALCLEVVEHLNRDDGAAMIRSLVKHANLIFFSAAAPGQIGQHHVNCQWPAYWQRIFNEFGFVCDDWPRRMMWNVGAIEPWYRQNMFAAVYAPEAAGTEEALQSLIHPEMLRRQALDFLSREWIEAGMMPSFWYLSLLGKAGAGKFKRRFSRASGWMHSIFLAIRGASEVGGPC